MTRLCFISNRAGTVTPSKVDGVHRDIPEQQALGHEVAQPAAQVLELG